MKITSEVLLKKRLNAIEVIEQLLRITKDNEPEDWRNYFFILMELLQVGKEDEAISKMRYTPLEQSCIWQLSTELEENVRQALQNLRVYKEWGNNLPFVELGNDPCIIREPTKRLRPVLFPPETMTLGQYCVRLCSYPVLMGHEELILPMLVTTPNSGPAMGKFKHYLKEGEFELNDLSNTAIMGVMSGYDDRARFDASSLFVGRYYENEWLEVPEIDNALSVCDKEYAFFYEESSAPLQDAFICRCRFIARDSLRLPLEQDHILAETTQNTTAECALAAFLQQSMILPYRYLHGDYTSCGPYYGDTDQFACEYAIWLEQTGIVRAWTRITYVPK